MTTVQARFTLRLELDKREPGAADPVLVNYELVQFAASFGINKIPTATCTVAVGRNVYSLEPAQIHNDFSSLKLMFPAKVFIRGIGRSSDRAVGYDWTLAGEQVIFDGYLTGIGYSKTQGKLHVTLQLIHWLSDLAFSSTLSNQSHPSNLAEVAFRDAYEPCATDLTGDTGSEFSVTSPRAMTAGARFHALFSAPNLLTDLWGKSILPTLCCLAGEDTIRLGLCGGETSGRTSNSQSLSALNRFETYVDPGPDASPPLCGVARKWSKPLAFVPGIVGSAWAEGISTYFGNELISSLRNTTIWDKLVQDYAPAFGFAIVPRVADALVVPYMPGIRDTWQKIIWSNDIESMDLSSFIRRPLRGVAIWSGREFQTTATNRTAAAEYGLLGPGGCYIPNPEAKGMLLVQRAPGWLKDVIDAAADAGTTLVGERAGVSARAPTSTATTPLLPETDEAADLLRPAETGMDAIKNSASVYQAVANWVYHSEVLRGRGGVVQTRFRMDIAPGSNVAIVTTGEPFIAAILGADSLQQYLVATVSQVAFRLDAESAVASTTFQLSNLRTLAENIDARTSSDIHPYYPEVAPFSGAPLVDAFLFPE